MCVAPEKQSRVNDFFSFQSLKAQGKNSQARRLLLTVQFSCVFVEKNIYILRDFTQFEKINFYLK